jgi:hypothetical protein
MNKSPVDECEVEEVQLSKADRSAAGLKIVL